MTANEFLKSVVSDAKGGYLFFGDEEYTKLSCLSRLRSLLFGQEGDPFNHHKIICSEPNWEDHLINALDALPMFAEKKMIELHSLSFSSLSESQLALLLEMFAEARQDDSTVLVVYSVGEELNAGKLPKAPSATFKKLCEVLEPVHCERQTPGRLAGWAGRHFAAEGVTASALVCQEMVDRCGNDMFALANEIKKLAYYTLAKGETAVSEADIPLVCSISKESGAFDFTNAILDGNALRALELLTDMRRRKERPEVVLGDIIDTLSALYLVKRLSEAGKKNAEIAAATGLHEFRVKLYAQNAVGIQSAPSFTKAKLVGSQTV